LNSYKYYQVYLNATYCNIAYLCKSKSIFWIYQYFIGDYCLSSFQLSAANKKTAFAKIHNPD